MNKEKELILEKTAKEYFSSGKEEFNKKKYNSSVVLFFKSLVSLIDLYILQNTGNTPSSHKQRFKITIKNFPEIYNLLDKDFPFYQDSYVQIMNKELAEVIRDDAQVMAKKVKIKI
jgi:hypothetical protein